MARAAWPARQPIRWWEIVERDATLGACPLKPGWPAAMVTNQWSPIDDPGYWRKRAQVIRALVENMREPEAKELMLRMAHEYEELAKVAEQRADGSPQRHIPAEGDSTNNLAG